MNYIHKKTLGLIWKCDVEGTDPVREMSQFLSAGEVRSRLDYLFHNGLITEDRHVTTSGRAALTVVMCGGVFDIVHHGHVHALTAAKTLGDVLCVVVASNQTAKKTKKIMHHDACTRRRIVAAIGAVDLCVVGHDSDMFETVRAVRPDIIALGYDQVHHAIHMEAGCRRLGLDTEVIRLESPMPDVTSSRLKEDVSLTVM